MRTCALAAAFALCHTGLLCAEEKIEVPSGQEVTFIDVVRDAPGPDGLTYRFRFLAPAIARADGKISNGALDVRETHRFSVAKHRNDEPADPRTLRPEIPAALSEIILACLAKHRAQRPSSATDLDRWLMRVRV